jgi:hypothetical protein
MTPAARRRYGSIAMTVTVVTTLVLGAASAYLANWRILGFGLPIIIYGFITGVVGRQWGKSSPPNISGK